MCEEGSRVRFEPCGHMVLCAECSVNIKRCPTCRVSSMTSKKKSSLILVSIIQEKVERKITVT